MPREILVSPGRGAGWSTWESDAVVSGLMLEWPPLIAAIKAGERPDVDHAAVIALREAIKEMGRDEPCLGGLDGLTVVTGEGQVMLEEHDGAEIAYWRNDDRLWY